MLSAYFSYAAFIPAGAIRRGEYLYELKIGGFRVLAHISDGTGELLPRNENVFRGFAELATGIAEHLKVEDAVLDGEITCIDGEGRPIFKDLLFRKSPCIFVAFDLLLLNGMDLRTLRLIERKRQAALRTDREDGFRGIGLQTEDLQGTALWRSHRRIG